MALLFIGAISIDAKADRLEYGRVHQRLPDQPVLGARGIHLQQPLVPAMLLPHCGLGAGLFSTVVAVAGAIQSGSPACFLDQHRCPLFELGVFPLFGSAQLPVTGEPSLGARFYGGFTAVAHPQLFAVYRRLPMPRNSNAAEPSQVTFVIVAGSILLLALAVFIVSFLLVYQRRQQQHQREKRALEEAFAAEVLRAQVEIGEQTLLRISQEIHDNFGQLLSLAKLNLGLLVRTVDAPTAEKLRETTELVGRTLTELRDLSKTLDANYALSDGLAAALTFQVMLVEKMGLCHASLQVEGQERRLDAQREVIVFRIVQELIQNTLKHAGARAISLYLSYGAQALELCVQDDGRGFELGEETFLPTGKRGSGLVNMRRRATLVGADFVLKSEIGTGTLAQLRLPYTNYTNPNSYDLAEDHRTRG